MAVTTQRLVYEGLLTDLKTVGEVHDDFIYITPMPLFSPADSVFIQLIPGVPLPQTEISGLGLIEDTFRVAVWSRVFLDQSGHSTERITDATYGVMKIVGDVRQVLIQSTADSTATIPVRWTSGASPVESSAEPGWVYYEDTYIVGYEVAWS